MIVPHGTNPTSWEDLDAPYQKPSASVSTEAMNKSFWMPLTEVAIANGLLKLLLVALVLFVGHVEGVGRH
jgi:hypothetical protein